MSGELDPGVARRCHRTLEPFHGMIYFAPEAQREYLALGVPQDVPLMGYFASRAAAIGPVPGEVVVATFFNFHPGLVAAAVPACWDVAPPTAWLGARRRGADDALRRVLGDAVESPEMHEAASLARAATTHADPAGRALFAGHLALDWPDVPHLELWHAITLLREHRGDGHVGALLAAGLSPTEALVLHDATGELPRGVLQQTRAWPDEDWEAAWESLRDRGWVEGDGLSDEGRHARDTIEARTDELALAPWRVLGEERCARLRALVRPWSRQIVGSGVFGGRMT